MTEKRARGEDAAGGEEPLTKRNADNEAFWDLTETRRCGFFLSCSLSDHTEPA